MKYISQILGRFTQGQRVLALLLLLLSTVLVTSGGDLIRAVKGLPVDVMSTLEAQEMRILNQQGQIQTLIDETSRLNSNIISIQQECTDKIIQREREIAARIQNIISLINRQERIHPIIIDTISSGNVHALIAPIGPNLNEIVYHLNELKKSLQH